MFQGVVGSFIVSGSLKYKMEMEKSWCKRGENLMGCGGVGETEGFVTSSSKGLSVCRHIFTMVN